ncbi:MAG: transporter substrate-binding protein [Actinomycetia bacterium]|nr:transporter substrate-binding protein [Actinomycetes bacterium]
MRARSSALLAVVALAAVGCSSGSGSFPDATPSAPTTETTAPPAQTDTNVDCGNPVASYAPTGPLPAPGHMPAGSAMATIAARGRLIVGVSADTKLFGARNPFTGRIEGFDIDMLREVSRAIFGDPDKIEYRVITYAQRLPVIEDGSVDLVAHTMTINCVRWQRISFSSEYFHAGQKILVQADSKATSIDEMDGERVCAAEGSTNIENIAKYPKVKTVGQVDLTDCLVLFQQGAVDAITGDDTVLAGFAAQDPYAKVIGDFFTQEPYGIGMSKDHPELTRFVNSVLERERADGTWKAIHQRWLGSPGAPPPAVYGRTP